MSTEQTDLSNLLYSPLEQTLFQKRVIQVSGAVDSKFAHRINRQLLTMHYEDPKSPITLFINSPGGEVNSGFSVIDMAHFIQPKIRTVVVGLAASMGSLIALSAASSKEDRFALPNAKFMIHQPLIPGGIFGQASDLEIHATDIIKTKRKINEIYSKETGRDISEVEKVTERDNWMNSEEAKSFGLISKVIQSIEELPA